MPLWIRSIAYLCVGMTAEVGFTGIKAGLRKDWKLPCHTTLWMFPIYAFFLPFSFEPLHDAIRFWPWIARGLAYGIGILAVEFCSATIFRFLLKQDPWRYERGWHLDGKIRLDYLPLWMAFGLSIERLHDFLLRLQL